MHRASPTRRHARWRRQATRLGVLAAVGLAVATCKAREPVGAALQSAPGGEPMHCAVARGNGPKIMAHFATLARDVETYGLPRGFSGGSSGSLVAFFYESLLMHPAMACNDLPPSTDAAARRRCTEDRASLALKSLIGYFGATAEQLKMRALELALRSPTILFGDAGKQLGVAAFTSALPALASPAGPLNGLRDQLLRVVTAPASPIAELDSDAGRRQQDDFAGLVNPRYLQLLKRDTLALDANKDATLAAGLAARRERHLKDFEEAVAGVAQFSGIKKKVFLRPGALNMGYVVGLFGNVGDFYAGRFGAAGGVDPTAKLGEFYATCATKARGHGWDEITQPTSAATLGTERCAGLFAEAVDATTRAAVKRSRLDERIGETPVEALGGEPLDMIVMTSVLVGRDAIDQWRAGQAVYEGSVSTAKDFDDAELAAAWRPAARDIRFGFFGRAAVLDRIIDGLGKRRAELAGRGRSLDPKTAKFFALGPATWRQALAVSPAEPGVAPLVPIDSNVTPRVAYARQIDDDPAHPTPPAPVLSIGGWPDHSPGEALRAMGCDGVLAYLTNPRHEPPQAPAPGVKPQPDFAHEVTRALGFDDELFLDLWGTTRKDAASGRSGYGAAYDAADLSWCADWDHPAWDEKDQNGKAKRSLFDMASYAYRPDFALHDAASPVAPERHADTPRRTRDGLAAYVDDFAKRRPPAPDGAERRASTGEWTPRLSECLPGATRVVAAP
jgi:hypothetical protein